MEVQEETSSLFRNEIQRAVKATKLTLCYQCAMCGAGCPVARLKDDFRPRLIFLRIALGDPSIVHDPDIWYCATCFNCQEVCPNGVKGTDFIFLLKNSATRLGNVPVGVKRFGEMLLKEGSASPVTAFTNKKREKMELPIFPSVKKEEVLTILKHTGFDKLISCSSGEKE